MAMLSAPLTAACAVQDHRAAARMYREERDQKTAEIYRAMRRGDYELSDKLKKEVSYLLCWHSGTQEVMTVLELALHHAVQACNCVCTVL